MPAALIVDDEPAARLMACEMFSGFGFECFDAWNGEAALRLLSIHPEIVILFADVRMPGMSGDELAREAMRMRPHLMVVLTSGWVGHRAVEGFTFVPKPYRLSDLESLLSRHDGVGQED